MPKNQKRALFAICISNEGSDDLQIWKLYRILPDEAAAAEGYMRVVDDSGEDYLYPESRFVVVDFPTVTEEKILAVAVSGV